MSDSECSDTSDRSPRTFLAATSRFLSNSVYQKESPLFYSKAVVPTEQLEESDGGLGTLFGLQSEAESPTIGIGGLPLSGNGNLHDTGVKDDVEARQIHVSQSETQDASRSKQSEHQDASWLALYLTCFCLTLFITIWAYFIAEPPVRLVYPIDPHKNDPDDDLEVEEAASLLSVIPLITSLTLFSIMSTMATMYALSRAVRRILYGLLVAGPSFLIVISFWTFGQSWARSLLGSDDDGQIGSEARWACLAAIVVAIASARIIYTRVTTIEKSVQVIELALTALLAHPALFVIQLGLLLTHLLLTLPFFTIFLRLLMLHPTNPDSPVLFYALFVLVVYLWSLSIMRNFSRLVSSIVISYWFFKRHEPSPSHGSATNLVRVAFEKARGPQLGTVIIASLVLTVVDMSTFAIVRLRRWLRRENRYLPSGLGILYIFSPLVVFLAALVESISGYTLVWAGLTGHGFWESAKSVSGLIRRNGMMRTADYLLVKTVLSLLTMSFSVLAGLLGILSASSAFDFTSVHTKAHFVHHAFSTLLAFFIPHVAVRLCSDLLSHAVDCIFICWNVDLESGQCHSTKAMDAFTSSSDMRGDEEAV